MKDRFEKKFLKTEGCWLWAAGMGDDGYGSFCVAGKMAKAHRVSYELYVGPIKKGLLALHKCDVPLCVNPEHLFLGTNADNAADRNAKGRQAKGVANGRAKLSEDAVRAIRSAEGFVQRELADIFGVSQSLISDVRSGKRWAHM